jgi:hypothetical protein
MFRGTNERVTMPAVGPVPPDSPNGPELDPFDEYPPSWAYMDAGDVVRQVQERERDPAGMLRLRRRPSVAPVLTISDRFLVGTLDLRAVEFPYLLEFVRCRFQEPPDLRQARLAGCEFRTCWLPGLRARNLSSDNDLMLVDGTVVDGTVDLTDGNIHGSLVLIGSRLNNPDGRTLHADRLHLAGALLGARMVSNGELRIPGLVTGGNANFAGAFLNNPKGYSINGPAMHIGGNMHLTQDAKAGPFRTVGRLLLVSAKVDSNFSLRDAILDPPRDEIPLPQPNERFFDPEVTLIADRIRVNGNLDADQSFRSTGTLRIVNAFVGGSLRLTGATIDLSDGAEPFTELGSRGDQEPYQHRALHLDGTDIRGGIDATDARIAGQIRMVDVVARGSTIFDGSIISNPNGDAIEGRRFTTGGNLDMRMSLVFGSVLLPGAKVGANVDLGGSRLVNPGYYQDRNRKPSINLRDSEITRDLICANRRGRSFSCHGEIRARRAQVGRETNFTGAELGSGPSGTVLNLSGLTTQELQLGVGVAPRGRVNLRHTRCLRLADNARFWDAEGRIDVDDFRYDTLAEPIPLEDDEQVRTRLRWLRHGMRDTYRPGPYDQFSAMLRASGNEEHASTVLLEKQRWRYVALSEGYRVLGPLVRLWSLAQRLMVGYGYRPMRALSWLVTVFASGTIWFAVQPRPLPVSVDDQHLVWNAPLYTLDQIVPIVDFGYANKWSFVGASQWISAVLVAVGWVLATTVAAGVSRMLRRNS